LHGSGIRATVRFCQAKTPNALSTSCVVLAYAKERR
jgi:flagellar biosynthesis component FlhA